MVIVGNLLMGLAGLYFLAGCGFALRFVTTTVARANDRARLSGPFFRLSIAPGAILLWPWLWYLERSGQLLPRIPATPENAS